MRVWVCATVGDIVTVQPVSERGSLVGSEAGRGRRGSEGGGGSTENWRTGVRAMCKFFIKSERAIRAAADGPLSLEGVVVRSGVVPREADHDGVAELLTEHFAQIVACSTKFGTRRAAQIYLMRVKV